MAEIGNRKRRSRGAVAASAALLVLSCTTILGGSPAAAETPSADWVSNPSANFSASMVAQSLLPLTVDPNYAGVWINAAGVQVGITGTPTLAQKLSLSSIVAGEADRLSSIPGVPHAVPVTFATVKYSLSSLRQLTDLLNSEEATWANKGFAFSSWGPNEETNAVVVHLQNYSPAAAKQLVSQYGPALSVAIDSETAAPSSRTADTAPWYGGDKITYGGSSCTSWFSLNGSLSATAGHCGGGAWLQNGHTFGTVSQRKFSGGVDAELIPVSSVDDRVWSDPTSTSRDVTGIASVDPAGGLVCTDGYVDREVCRVKINGTYQSVTYGGQTITGLTSANQLDGKAAFTPGDSGGPVETTSGSTATIAQGMIVAHNYELQGVVHAGEGGHQLLRRQPQDQLILRSP